MAPWGALFPVQLSNPSLSSGYVDETTPASLGNRDLVILSASYPIFQVRLTLGHRSG